MKNTIAVVALSSFFVFTACKKNEPGNTSTEKTVNTEENKQSQKLEIDSVEVSDSIKIGKLLKVSYTSQLLVFPTLKDQKLLDSIYFANEGIKDFSKNGLKSYLEKEKNVYFDSMKRDSDELTGPSQAQDWYSSSHMRLKSNMNDYMHIQYTGSSYEGGAHDNYGFSERVFDLKNNKKVELTDITTMPKNKIEEILMKNIDKINSGITDAEGKVKGSDMLLVKVIPASDNFYFDDKNLYFHYSPYEIAAFAAGDITIPVSWDDLKGTLKPEFKERMKIK